MIANAALRGSSINPREVVMRISSRLLVCLSVICALAFVSTAIAVDPVKKEAKKATKAKVPKTEAPVSEPKLPPTVQKTFDNKFPNGKIEKLDAEKEGGVMVYDIEFREGRTHKETDIAEDGTMLEYTVFVAKKTLPKKAMKQIEKAAEGLKMQRMAERIEISYETKDGKVVKLDKPKTHYAVMLIKDDKEAEIVVDGDGKVIEEPDWTTAEKSKPEAASDTGKKA
jgi:hypothetical protein